MDELRVLQFVNILDRGGTESFIFNNLDKMDREQIGFDFILTRDAVEPRETDLKKYGCKKIVIVPSAGSRVHQYIDLYKKLKQYFSNSGYKIVHFQSNPPGIMATASVIAAWRAGIPARILHSHGAGGENVSYRWLRPIITGVCRLINTRCCNYFIAPSRMSAEYGFGKNVANSSKCKIIKNAIDVEKYLYSEEKRSEYRNELKIKESSFVMGTVGRISEVKNHKFMIDLFARYLEHNKDAILLIVGGIVESERWVLDEIEKSINKYGIEDNVILYGECSDIPGILNAMDVFLFTSKSEALGIAAIEAQVNGMYVFAAKDGIPTDLDITGNVVWNSLNAPISSWVNALMEIPSKRNDISIMDESIRNIDSRKTAKDLSQAYIDLVGIGGKI